MVGNAADGHEPTLSLAERDQLVRVLDRRLVILALAQLLGKPDSVAPLADELGVTLTDGTVLVAIKVDPAAKATDALRAIGATIAAEDPARGLVVARVSMPQLAKLASTTGIKRVEPLTGG